MTALLHCLEHRAIPASAWSLRVPLATVAALNIVACAAQPASAEPPATQPAAAASRTIAGRVVDDQGQFVRAARLWWVVSHGEKADIVEGTSDASGQFRMTAPIKPLSRPSIANDMLWVWAEGKSLAVARAREGLVADDAAIELVIRLGGATDTSFLVVSPDGKPVAGVVVEPWHFLAPIAYDILCEPLRKLLAATTDAQGRARLPGLPRKGFYTVRTLSTEYGTQTLRLEDKESSPAERTIRLRRTAHVKGRLQADSEWVRGIKLWLSSEEPNLQTVPIDERTSRTIWETEGHAEVTTDANGAFEVPAIAAGRLRIDLTMPKDSLLLPRLGEQWMLSAGAVESLEIPMQPSVLARGTIRTQDTDQPVPGAEISVRYGAWRQGEVVISDAQGRYEARVLPGPVYTQVIVRPPEFRNYEQTGQPWAEKFTVPAEVTFDLPAIVLAPTLVIKGKLIDQQGRPVAKARLNALRGNRRYGFSRTSASGEFSMQVPKALEVDGYQVWLEDDDVPYTPEIQQREPLILRLDVSPAAKAGDDTQR